MSVLFGRVIDSGETTVAVNGGGAGTAAVTFAQTFTSTPSILVVPDEADEAAGASYTAASATKTGFTMTIASSRLTSRDVKVVWFAVQKS